MEVTMSETLVDDWIANELKTVDVGDKRLNERCGKVFETLFKHPNVSIPAACRGHSEMMATYRFFENEKTTLANMMQPHQDATEIRCAEQEVVLCVQDTTEIDLTRPSQPVRGIGPIGSGATKRGVHLHLLEAFTPNGMPLGTIWYKDFIRDDESVLPEQKKQKKQNRPKLPIEKKESFRWLEGYRKTIAMAERHPNTEFICIGDSESDIFEVLNEKRKSNAHLIVRACYDRKTIDENETISNIRSVVNATPIIATKKLHVRARPAAVPQATGKRDKARTTRDAFLEIRKAAVTIQPPLNQQGKHRALRINVIIVSEANPPAGESSVEWILLTTLPIDTLEQVLRVIAYDEQRWAIEIFFKTLKSGCKIEDLQFEEYSRFAPCLGVYLVVTWRLLMVCQMGRVHPDWSCEILFDETEWKSVHKIMYPKKKVPTTPPTINVMIRMIGELGGWVATPGKKEMPGAKTMWIGLQRTHDFANAWKIFGQG